MNFPNANTQKKYIIQYLLNILDSSVSSVRATITGGSERSALISNEKNSAIKYDNQIGLSTSSSLCTQEKNGRAWYFYYQCWTNTLCDELRWTTQTLPVLVANGKLLYSAIIFSGKTLSCANTMNMKTTYDQCL